MCVALCLTPLCPHVFRKLYRPLRDDIFYRRSRFLTTSRMIRLFSAGMKAPTPGAKVIYLDGQ